MPNDTGRPPAPEAAGRPDAPPRRFTTLIAPSELAPQVADPRWVVVDCRFDLAAPEAGEGAYLAGHIPGAVYAHLDRDLSSRPTGVNGRHPLPEAGTMADVFGRLGIGPGVQVVAYDQDVGMYASRLWWMLRYLGHDAVAVLEGGLARWRAEGRPVTAGRVVRPPRTFLPAVRHAMLVTVEDVASMVGDPAWRLVDARAPERFRGDVEPLDPVAGHIPGAMNLPHRDNVAAHGRFLDAAELRARFAAAIDTTPPDRVVLYCGSGVSACHDLLAMEVAGVGGARLYAGSWSEWCADPSRPVARGER